MNEEILAIPREYLRDMIKIIRKGTQDSQVNASLAEELEIWCDNMAEELHEEEKDSFD